MSHVINVVIISNEFMDLGNKIAILNSWIMDKSNGKGGVFEELDRSKSAGTKSPERILMWGGFNYFEEDEFVDFFKSLKLEDSIAIFSSPEEGEYRIVKSRTNVRIL